MLSAATPFPQQGSYALYTRGLTQIARIISVDTRDGVKVATISLVIRAGASGNRRVPLAELRDPTPLDAVEQAQLAELERVWLNAPRPRGRWQRAAYDHFHALRDRLIAADAFAALQAAAGRRRAA